MLPRRLLLILDVLVAVLLLLNIGGVVMALTGSASVAEFPAWLNIVLGAAPVLSAVLWVAWRITGRPLILPAFALMAMLQGGGSTTMVLVCLGLALTVALNGLRLGLITLAVLLVVSQAVQLAIFGPGWSMVTEVVVITAMLGLGLVLGETVRHLLAERRRNAELLAEVRRTAAAERDLMLADERARSARDLHDGLGHRLTLIQISLAYAAKMRDREPERAAEEVETARAAAGEALEHMRTWVRALNPPRPSSSEPGEGFEAIAASFRGTGLDVRVQQTGTPRELGRDTSLFAHRMLQEGLTNVLRHSDASAVEIRVDWGAEEIGLSLQDDGGPGAALSDGFGLRSLTERAAELGGGFRAEAGEHGVRLEARVPAAASPVAEAAEVQA